MEEDSPEKQTEVKEEVNEEDWTAIEEEDPRDPDFKGVGNAAFTVYEVSYKGRPRRSMRSRRKVDKDFLYLSNAKRSRKTREKQEENSSEETLSSESDAVRLEDDRAGNGNLADTSSLVQREVAKVKRGRGRPRKRPLNASNYDNASFIEKETLTMQVALSENPEEENTETVSKDVTTMEGVQENEIALDDGNQSASLTNTQNSNEREGDTGQETAGHIDRQDRVESSAENQVALLQGENVDSLIDTNNKTAKITDTHVIIAIEEMPSKQELVDEIADANHSITGGEESVKQSEDPISPAESGDQTLVEMDNAEEGAETEERQASSIDNQTIMKEMKRIRNLEKLKTKYKNLCKYCGKHFKSIHYLKLHLPMHTGRFSCRYCGFQFARKESLVKHECKIKKIINLVEKDGIEYFQCSLCEKEMESVTEAKDHYLFHKKEVRCLDCNQVFGRQQLLRDHICPEAPQKLIKCDICKHPFPSEKSLLRHLAMHTDIFKCPNCLKTFARKDSQLKHILVCCPEKAEEYNVYACRKCRKGFATKLGLDNHETLCEQEMCENCNKVFDSLDVLKKHQDTCKQPKTYVKKDKVLFPCSICKKSFRNLNYLNRHKELHTDQLECSICKKTFKAQNDLDDHFRFCLANKTITEQGNAVCEICAAVLYSIKGYRDHFLTHTHPYSCEKCGKCFIKVGTLHTHQCVLDTSLVECHHCQEQFPGQAALKFHIKKEHRKNIQCKTCEKDFINYKDFETHMCEDEFGNPTQYVPEKELSVMGDKPVCYICGKEFTTTSNMNKHMKTHGEKNVECEICKKKFHHEEYLKVHVEGVHEKKNRYQCAECGKFLTSKPGLTSHMKQFHSDEKEVFPCSECGKIFSQKGNRKMHMYSHMKEKLFKCDVCAKTFKYPEQLKKHKFIHMAGEKLKCESCEKLFPRRADLEKHMQAAHNGIMYVCNVCNSRCAHKHTLLRHYRRKHPEYEDFMKDDSFLNSLVQKVGNQPGEHTPMVTYSYINESMAIPMETVTIEDNTLPQVAAQALKSLSSMTTDQQILTTANLQGFSSGDIISVPAIDGNFQIQNLVQDPSSTEDQQTVVILQIVNQENEQGVVSEEVEVIGNVVDLP